MEPYDSTADTQAHIDRVNQLLNMASDALIRRGEGVFPSKLVSLDKYPDGVNDFDLFDLLEMFLIWKASEETGIGDDLITAIEVNAKKGAISEQVARIFYNTSQRYAEMLKKPEEKKVPQ